MTTNLIPSLKASLFNPISTSMSDSLIDIAELGLDSVLQDGVLKDVPIFGTIASLCKTGVNLRERNLIRQTAVFITSRAHCERVYTNESVDTKIFIGFVATIIRNRICTLLIDEMRRMDKKQNFMTVPAAIKELEKIEMLKGADNEYSLDYSITATQKAILNAFDMTADNVHRQARDISSNLLRIEMEAIEANAAKNGKDRGVRNGQKNDNIG